jgi:hypothetical protein
MAVVLVPAPLWAPAVLSEHLHKSLLAEPLDWLRFQPLDLLDQTTGILVNCLPMSLHTPMEVLAAPSTRACQSGTDPTVEHRNQLMIAYLVVVRIRTHSLAGLAHTVVAVLDAG